MGFQGACYVSSQECSSSHLRLRVSFHTRRLRLFFSLQTLRVWWILCGSSPGQPAIRPSRVRPVHVSCSGHRHWRADSLSHVAARALPTGTEQRGPARRKGRNPLSRIKQNRTLTATEPLGCGLTRISGVAAVASTSWPQAGGPSQRSLAFSLAAARSGDTWSWPGRLRRSTANSIRRERLG